MSVIRKSRPILLAVAGAALASTASVAQAQSWDRFFFDGVGAVPTIDVVVSDDFRLL